MKLMVLALSLSLASAGAEEWPVLNGTSPSKREELVTIPIFASDPINETPYRIALRDKASKKILDSFLWEGDMGDSEAHKENKAVWSPGGQYLAIRMTSGRQTVITAYFFVHRGKLVRLNPPDVWQNVLGRFNATQAGPIGGVSPVAWIGERRLKVAVSGVAETVTDGQMPFHYHAVYEFFGDDHSEPYMDLISADPAPEKSEESNAARSPKPSR